MIETYFAVRTRLTVAGIALFGIIGIIALVKKWKEWAEYRKYKEAYDVLKNIIPVTTAEQ